MTRRYGVSRGLSRLGIGVSRNGARAVSNRAVAGGFQAGTSLIRKPMVAALLRAPCVHRSLPLPRVAAAAVVAAAAEVLRQAHNLLVGLGDAGGLRLWSG